MNSRTCTILSEGPSPIPALRAAFLRATAGAAAAILIGCGGGKPDPRDREPEPYLPMASQNAGAGEKGEGAITFHYSNKSTDANLSIDLGTTDVYLEMSGKAAQEMAESVRPPQRGEAADKRSPVQRKPAKAEPREDAEETGEQDHPKSAMMTSPQSPRKPAPKPDPMKPEPPSEEEDHGNYEDVTSKVLTGIRRAQELFYQKRYPEAMQAVRSSLDARPTAEGHALAGSIHYMQGQGGMARRQWMEALRLNPDMPAVVNMLEKTRTPGGRGSPSPRPIQSRPAPRPAATALPPVDQAPFPEEYGNPQNATPVAPAPVAPAPAAPAPSAPAPAPEPEASIIDETSPSGESAESAAPEAASAASVAAPVPAPAKAAPTTTTTAPAKAASKTAPAESAKVETKKAKTPLPGSKEAKPR
jgi:hypothetical protein